MAEYQFENTHIGKRFAVDPIPVVEEVTTRYPAGVLTFGVEGRALTDDGADAPWAGGPALHVFDTETGIEYLRFDAFPGFEHYHYLHIGQSNHVVGYDVAANGDFLDWIVDRVKNHLPGLLAQTSGAHLADRIDAAKVQAAVAKVSTHLRSRDLQLAAPKATA